MSKSVGGIVVFHLANKWQFIANWLSNKIGSFYSICILTILSGLRWRLQTTGSPNTRPRGHKSCTTSSSFGDSLPVLYEVHVLTDNRVGNVDTATKNESEFLKCDMLTLRVLYH